MAKVKLTPSEAIVETLLAEQVDHVTGIVGSAFMDMLDLFPAAGIRFILANVAMLVLGFYGSRHVARLISLPTYLLAPLVVFMTFIGSYAIRNNMLDVGIVVFFGLVGYITKKLGFHPAPIVLGLILGPIAENGLVQSMLMGKSVGSMFQVFFTRPISIILILLSLVSVALPAISAIRNKKGGKGGVHAA